MQVSLDGSNDVQPVILKTVKISRQSSAQQQHCVHLVAGANDGSVGGKFGSVLKNMARFNPEVILH